MEEIVGSIRRVTDIMGEISAASSEQSAGVAQVGEAVSQMDQATQQNAALVEEMAAAASSLSTQAQDLVQAVSVFKLDQSMTGGAPVRHVSIAPTAMGKPQSSSSKLVAKSAANGSDQILQAVFEVPESAGFSINDITINNQKVNYVWVIAQQLLVGLSVTVKPLSATPQAFPCVQDRVAGLQPWPVQLLPLDLFYGQSPTDLPPAPPCTSSC